MCSKISWEQFLTIAGAIIVLYYVVVGVLYYRKDLGNVVKPGSRRTPDNHQPTEGSPLSYNEFTAESGDAFKDTPN